MADVEYPHMGQTVTDARADTSTGRRRPESGGHKHWQRLSGDLARAVPDAAAAVILSGVVYGVLWARIQAGTSPAMTTMGQSMGMSGMRAYTISQALGFVAVVWSWASLILGLTLATDWWRPRPASRGIVERLHRTTSLTVIGLILAHAVVLLWDNMDSATVGQLFVPFASGYAAQRFPLALGILALYGAVLIGPSYYLRDRIGQRAWRVIHRAVIPVVYAVGVWHTFARGEDLTTFNPVWYALWAMQIPLVALLLLRLAAPARRSERWWPIRWFRSSRNRRGYQSSHRSATKDSSETGT